MNIFSQTTAISNTVNGLIYIRLEKNDRVCSASKIPDQKFIRNGFGKRKTSYSFSSPCPSPAGRQHGVKTEKTILSEVKNT